MNDSNDEELTLKEHLEELRRRAIYSAIALVFTIGVSLYFASDIFDVLKQLAPEDTHFIFTEPMELMLTYFKMALYGGIALALPFLVYQAFMFARPGLTCRERRWLYMMIPAVALFFAVGIAFGYYFVPRMLSFMLEFPFAKDVADPEIKISSYVSLLIRFLFGIGLVFEIPLMIFFLSKIGVMTPQWLLNKWRYAIVISYIAAAVITPTPDMVNCTIVAAVIMMLYLLGIIFARIAQGQNSKTANAH